MNITIITIVISVIVTVALLLITLTLLLKKLTGTIKTLFIVASVVIALITVFALSVLLNKPVANLLYKQVEVPCFLLSDDNCEKSGYCTLSVLDDGSGEENFFCTDKIQIDY